MRYMLFVETPPTPGISSPVILLRKGKWKVIRNHASVVFTLNGTPLPTSQELEITSLSQACKFTFMGGGTTPLTASIQCLD